MRNLHLQLQSASMRIQTITWTYIIQPSTIHTRLAEIQVFLFTLGQSDTIARVDTWSSQM
jgi:hypothetical protein